MNNAQLDTASPHAPLVSVAMTTYNLANWLPRALDSVLAQKTTFSVELVIGDDCSQDTTLNVAHSYREKHPELIRLVERSKNVGIMRNNYETFEQCQGKYIAWLDADDYWTDPQKLSLQVEVLESDPRINMCCHVVRCITSDGEIKRERAPRLPAGRYGLGEILDRNFVPSPSAMFRNGIQRQLPEWFFDLKSIPDWPIWVLSALTGDIYLLDNVMADYMLSSSSNYWGKGGLFWNQSDADFYDRVESILPPKWRRVARAAKGKRYETIAYILRKQGDFLASREAAIKAFRAPSLFDNVGSKSKSLFASLVREAEWRIGMRRTGSGR